MDLSNLQMEPWPEDDTAASQAKQQMQAWFVQVQSALSEPDEWDEWDDDDDITGMTIESLRSTLK